jgi:uncharacterized protein
MRLAINDLVGRPGETRAVNERVPADAFGSDPWGPVVDAIVDDIDCDLHLDSVVEGILVRGTLGVALEVACGRCLTPTVINRTVSVAELFVDPTKRFYTDEEDAEEAEFVLLDDNTAIDLSVMARDAVVLDLPLQVLCQPACKGLCPQCGEDRNMSACGHVDASAPDPRWEALRKLQLPE